MCKSQVSFALLAPPGGAYMGLLAPPSESVFNGLIDLADANIFSETKIVGVWGGSMAFLGARDANASKNE